MSFADLPETVLTLLRDHLKTFEELEVLLLLQAHPLQSWTIESTSKTVGLPADLVMQAVCGLQAGGFIAPETCATEYRYRPASAELARAVDDLALTYGERRAAVMSQMSVNAIKRIRSGTMRAFADAFVIKKGNGDG